VEGTPLETGLTLWRQRIEQSLVWMRDAIQNRGRLLLEQGRNIQARDQKELNK
jgi:hypothetical protein